MYQSVQADWGIVEKGWKAHVLGEAPNKFKDAKTAVVELRVRRIWMNHDVTQRMCITWLAHVAYQGSCTAWAHASTNCTEIEQM